MILLSDLQCKKYAIPLIYKCMGNELGKRAESEFEEGCDCGWGYWCKDKLIAIGGIGSEISNKKIWLGYFAVHPDYRCKGLGNEVLNFIEQEIKKAEYKWIYVETYQHPMFDNAIKFYKKRGYKDVGYLSDYLNDDSDILYLRKCLED